MDYAHIIEQKKWLIDINVTKGYNSEILAKLKDCSGVLFTCLYDENIADGNRLLLTDCIAVYLLRVYQIIKNESTSEFEGEIRDTFLNEARATFLFRYVIDFWNDGGTPLSNSLKDMFNKLLKLQKVLYREKFTLLFKKWILQTLNIEPSMRVKYCLLELFTNEMDMEILINNKLNFLETSLYHMKSDSMSNSIGKCISSLLSNIYRYHYSKESIDKWLELWDQSIMEYLQNPVYTKKIQLYILSNLFSGLPPEIFERFIKRNLNQKYNMLLPLLRLGQDLSIEDEPFHEEKLISLKDLEIFLNLDEYKLSAFELLTYSRKISKPVRPYVLNIIMNNLDIFFVDIDLETRNYFHSSFRLFIHRIRDSCCSLYRDSMKLKAKNKFPEEQLEKLNQVYMCEKFLKWFVLFLKGQIIPGSQYQRISLAYRCINTLIKSGIDETIHKKYLDPKKTTEYPYHIQLFDAGVIRALIDNLRNEYNDIRESSLQLLTIAYESSGWKSMLSFENIDILKFKAYNLVSVYQESSGGAKTIEFLYKISDNKTEFMLELINILDSRLDAAQKNLIEGIKCPTSGLFEAIGLLMGNINYHTHNNINIFITSCINFVQTNWDTVNEIMCHDPSKGNLPSKYMGCGISDQVITSYAFRSIKETSLLINVLLNNAPLSANLIIRIGDMLIEQLISIRHSGGIQSILPAFVSCCVRCLKEMPTQLEIWLKDNISSLKTRKQYITRRSGGLPFLITSILSVEEDESRPWLKYTLSNLIKTVRVPIKEHEEKLDLPQISAFNCIKAIFVESKLSRPCTLYVHSALELCLEYFTSPVWGMRNCSMMLFTALQNRLFGKPGKGISARLFFTKYKSIKNTLLEKLEAINSDTADCGYKDIILLSMPEYHHIESTFLVLSILSKLKVTPEYTGLDEFKVQVIKCLGNKNWKIRELAARSLPTLVNDPYKTCKDLLDALNDKFSQNTLHGYLLAIKEILIKEKKGLDSILIPEYFSYTVIAGYERFLLDNPSYVTSKSYVEILELILKVIQDEKMVKTVINLLGTYFIQNDRDYLTDGSKQLLLASIVKILLKYETKENIIDIILLGLYSPHFEVQLSVINIIIDKINLDEDIYISVVEKLINMLNDHSLWSYLKVFIIKALQKSPKKLNSHLLFDILKDTKSEPLQSSSLELLGLSIEVADSSFMTLIDKYSQDTSSYCLRKSSLNALINFSSRFNDPKVIFKIYQTLFDDDLGIRRSAAYFLNKNFLKLPSEQWYTAPIETVKLFMKYYTYQFDKSQTFEILFNVLTHINFKFNFKISKVNNCEELFTPEDDNQFRNHILQYSQLIEMLKLINYNNNIINKYINSLLHLMIHTLDESEIPDSIWGWGSNSITFMEIVILRKLVAIFDPKSLDLLNNKLKYKKCHPLVFKICI